MQFIKTLTASGHELCENVKGLLNTLSEKFKPQHNETTLFLQYCKLTRGMNVLKDTSEVASG